MNAVRLIPLFLAVISIAAVSASQVLTVERKSATDVHVQGLFKSVGYLPWTEGLTLRDAFAAAGGPQAIVHGYWVIPRATDKSRKSRTILDREIKSDRTLLELRLQQGDTVHAFPRL